MTCNSDTYENYWYLQIANNNFKNMKRNYRFFVIENFHK